MSERRWVAANGQEITEEMVGRWCDAYERGEFPEGERAVGGVVRGRPPLSAEGTAEMSGADVPAASFTIEFDEVRAAAHGTTVDELYDRVGAFVEPYGNVRVGRGTWRAREGADGFLAQPVTLARLVRERWVMESVGSITYRESGVEGDYLDVVRRVSPHLICE